MLVLFLGASARLFVWPPTNHVEQADAVFVLGGGSGERLSTARDLMAREVAPVLVVSAGRELEPDEAGGLCSEPQHFEVVCIVPKPDDTRGEARAFARLARERQWDDVVLVTSTYHVTRAQMLIERCLDGRLEVVAARPPRVTWAAMIAHEWLGTVQAVVRRSC
jgi:uncharacterized SAM-binding protein YcdF (DUF218 family)